MIMKRILLSILLTIVATGANAQFRASINMKPDFSQEGNKCRCRLQRGDSQ